MAVAYYKLSMSEIAELTLKRYVLIGLCMTSLYIYFVSGCDQSGTCIIYIDILHFRLLPLADIDY